MSPRAMVVVALLALGLAVLVVLLDVPGWLPPRVQPLPFTPPGASPSVAAAPPLKTGCAFHARRVCDGGDVWWLDGCGQKQDQAEGCDDDAVCRGGRCERSPAGPACEGLSEGGRCDGNLLRYCDHGSARAVDCGARRCALDENREPNCVTAASCEDRCHGPIAEYCDEGGRHLILCGESCQLVDRRARCVERAKCEGCACPSPSPDDSVAVDVVAFLAADDDGRTAESEERVQADFERTRALLEPARVELRLREVRTIRRPAWLAATSATVHEAERDPVLHPKDQPFFVPIVYVRELQMGEKQTPGVGTFPGGACADLPPFRRGPDDSGVIVLRRLRYPTTLAHELGHFFGLCHTHQPDPRVTKTLLRDDGTPLECAACTQHGDGVCDTPVDPGVDECKLDEASCTVSCPSGATPDPTNLMSYFVACRSHFSAEQEAYLRRWARWRRQAHEAHAN